MVETDEVVMLAVRNGEVSKLGTLFDRHHRVLFDYLTRMTGDRAIADDLVQEVFYRILKYRKTFQQSSRFAAWMYGIARNVRMDHYRKHRFPHRPAEDAAEIPDSAAGENDSIEFERQSRLLEQALLQLSEDKREVLILSRYQDMKYEQIAEVLGCEVNTVKTRVHRALKDLRGLLCNVKKSEKTCRTT